MDKNLNRLQQYMELYQRNRLGPQMNTVSTPSSPMNGDLSVPIAGANGSGGAGAAHWASQQMGLDDQSAQRQPPNFFGNGGGGGMSTPYVQPQMPSGDNPYTPRATQLNNDPYSGQGGQPEIQNYLRKLMGGGSPGSGYRMNNSTVGVRG